jgi:hypothetical protein
MAKTDEDRVSSQDPVFAVLDAKRRNKENQELFSVTDRAFAHNIYDQINDVFFRRNVYLNFNLNSIVVKVNKPRIEDRIDPAVKKLDKDLEALDITYKTNKQGNRIYTLPCEPEENL